MSQEYIFEYSGTMERFLDKLNGFSSDSYYDGKFYYLNDYMIKIVDDEIHFGVERAGHSGGYWFIPTITEHDGKVEFRGTIEYIGPEKTTTADERSAFKKCIENIFASIAFVVLLPILALPILISLIYELFNRMKYKRQYPDAGKMKTTEDKLINLMEYHLRCIRK